MKFHAVAKVISLAATLVLLAACANDPGVQTVVLAPEAAVEPTEEVKPTVCADPRPQMCTMDYQPVCATRDTGIRCVTTPCPSSEKKTFSNGCGACSDPKVSEYVPEACADGIPNAVDTGVDG